jgi:hypothetical protein
MLAAMTPLQVADAVGEVTARLPPSAVDFLRARGAAKKREVKEEAAPAPPAPSTACFPPAAAAAADEPPPTPADLAARVRFALDGTPLALAPAVSIPADALQRDPLRSDATGEGYTLAEAAALARSALPAQRSAGLGLLRAVVVVAGAAPAGEAVALDGGADLPTPAPRLTWRDVLAAARLRTGRALTAGVAESTPAAAASAVGALAALAAPTGAGVDAAPVWAAAGAASPAFVSRAPAVRPHPVAAWTRPAADEAGGGDADAAFGGDILAAAFAAGLGPALASHLADRDADPAPSIALLHAAGLAGGPAAAAATAAAGGALAALAGDPGARPAARAAALDAIATLASAAASHARLLADSGAPGAAVSAALAGAGGGADATLAPPALRAWAAFVAKGVPCMRLDDAVAGLAPCLIMGHRDSDSPSSSAAAFRLLDAAVRSRDDAVVSPACAATLAAEAAWVLEDAALADAGAAWARGDPLPASRLAAALHAMASVACSVGGEAAGRLGQALAGSSLAKPEEGGAGPDLVAAALDAVASCFAGATASATDAVRAVVAADLVRAVLAAAAAAAPGGAPPLAGAAWAALGHAVASAAAIAPATATSWTTHDAATAQVALVGLAALEVAAAVVLAASPPDPPLLPTLLSAIRLLPPGAEMLGLRLLSTAMTPQSLEPAAAAAAAAVGALASADKPLARAARGGAGEWAEPDAVTAQALGSRLLQAYAHAWLGFGVMGGGRGVAPPAPARTLPLPKTLLPAPGSRLPPPSDWLLADFCGADPADGAAAAGAALTLWLGLEATRAPPARAVSPGGRLGMLLDVAIGTSCPPAEPWRDARARWCLAALAARGVAPPACMTASAATRVATAFTADMFGDPLVGNLLARVLMPGACPAASRAAVDALDDGDALWLLPPVADVEALGRASDELGARLATALAGGRLGRALKGERGVGAAAALGLDWAIRACFEAGNASLLLSFITAAPPAELAALLTWAGEIGGGGGSGAATTTPALAARVAAARAAAGGNAHLLEKIEQAAAAGRERSV